MVEDGPKVRSDSEWEIVVIISGLNKKSINLNRSLSRINCRNKKNHTKGVSCKYYDQSQGTR